MCRCLTVWQFRKHFDPRNEGKTSDLISSPWVWREKLKQIKELSFCVLAGGETGGTTRDFYGAQNQNT